MGRIRLALFILVGVAAIALGAYVIDGARTDQYESVAVFGVVDGLPDTDRVRLAGELAPEINSSLFLSSVNERIGDGDVRELRASPSDDGDIRVKIRAGSAAGIESGIEVAFEQLRQDQSANRQRQVGNDLADIERRLTTIDQSLSAGQGDTDLLTEERDALLGEQQLLIETIDVSPVELVEPAKRPSSPASPRPGRTALWTALIASVFGAMALLRFGRSSKAPSEAPPIDDEADMIVAPPAAAPAAQPGLLSSRLAGDAAMAAQGATNGGADRRFGRAAPLVSVATTATADSELIEEAPAEEVSAKDVSTEDVPAKDVSTEDVSAEELSAKDVSTEDVSADEHAAEGAGNVADTDTPFVAAAPQESDQILPDDSPHPLVDDQTDDTPATASVLPLPGNSDDVARRLDDAPDVAASFVIRHDGAAGHEAGDRVAASLADRGQTAAHIRVTTAVTAAERLVYQRWSNDEAVVADRAMTAGKQQPYTRLAIENPRVHDLEKAVEQLRASNDHVLISVDVMDVDRVLAFASTADALVVDADRDSSPLAMAHRFASLPHVATLQTNKKSGGVPWWLIAAGAAVLLAGGIGAIVALASDDDNQNQAATAAATISVDSVPVSAVPGDSVPIDSAPINTDPFEAASDDDTDPTVAPSTTPPETAPPATTTPADTAPPATAAPGGDDSPNFVLVLPDELPGIEQPARQGVYRGGTLYLEGEVESEAVADEIIARAVAVIGEENVVNNYVINPDAPQSNDGTILIDEDILFSFGSAFLDPTDNELLGLGEAVLRLYPNVTMRIVGHTDNVGSAQTNLALSVDRAQALANYYLSIGLPADRFVVEGRGESQPVGPNLTEEGRAQNRRIVVELIDLLS